MASKSRSKARPKRRVAPRKSPIKVSLGVVLWGLALVNLAIGLGLSEATALRSVTVKGVGADEIKGIEKRLAPWAKIPWSRQNVATMETAILGDNRLASAQVTTNIFGRGEVSVVRRNPVGRLETKIEEGSVPTSGYYLDESGFVFRDGWAEQFAGASVRLPDGAKNLHLAVMPIWPMRAVGVVCAKSQVLWPEQALTVVLDERSVLSLELVNGPRIILGTESDLDEKFLVLERAFRDEMEKMKRTKVINVSAPDRPVFSE